MMNKKEPKHCLNCDKILSDRSSIYCSMKCLQEDKYKERINKYLKGEIEGWTSKGVQLAIWLRRYIKEIRGSSCSKCGWDEKHSIDGKSLTEINHIDGDAKNCKLENLEVLCPNCHSKTTNFRARNKKSSRIRN